jgi:hypothetical protein
MSIKIYRYPSLPCSGALSLHGLDKQTGDVFHRYAPFSFRLLDAFKMVLAKRAIGGKGVSALSPLK